MNVLYSIMILALVLLTGSMSIEDEIQEEAAVKNPKPKTYYAYQE